MFHILVVEDDRDLRELFCRTLQKNQYQPYPAKDADEALEILDKEYIDLIVTDIIMPGTDGFTFVKELRECRIETPVLIITAKGELSDKKKGFTVGADDYMVKPIHLDEMLLRIQALLRRSKSISEKKTNLLPYYAGISDVDCHRRQRLANSPPKRIFAFVQAPVLPGTNLYQTTNSR